jgi:hypothetical protein
VRDARPSDLAYLTEVWITQATRHVHGQSVRSLKSKAQDIMAKSTIHVACLPDDQDAIVGFAVVEGSRVHMAYTRASARRLGVMKSIFARVQ